MINSRKRIYPFDYYDSNIPLKKTKYYHNQQIMKINNIKKNKLPINNYSIRYHYNYNINIHNYCNCSKNEIINDQKIEYHNDPMIIDNTIYQHNEKKKNNYQNNYQKNNFESNMDID